MDTDSWRSYAAELLGPSSSSSSGVVSGKLGPPLSPVAEVLEESPTGAARDTA